MPFCSFSSELIIDTATAVDNVFLSEYMTDAPKHCITVYLYGLYLCNNIHDGDNSPEIMARALTLTVDDILDAYAYWEDLGLVNIIHTKPIEIKYLPLRSSTSRIIKKIKPGKYKDFNKQMQEQIHARLIGPNEYNEYYVFLETTHFEPEALVEIAHYCVDLRGADISSNYILKVARDFASAGHKNTVAVEERIENDKKYNPALFEIFKAAGIKRAIDHDDRDKYRKWTKTLRFSDDVIQKVAKKQKGKGGIEKLDNILTEYYKLGVTDLKSIEHYQSEKEALFALAKDINKIIGVYYENLDYTIETYTSVWKNKGFTPEALLLIAKSCYAQNIRTLEHMNAAVEKFAKLGLLTPPAITQHIEKLRENDTHIQEVLDTVGLLRAITSGDRAAYKNWTQNWCMPHDLILYAASFSAAATAPIQYLSRILSNYKDKNITAVEDAKKSSPAATPQKSALPAREDYTSKDLAALFDDLDNLVI